MRKLNLGCADNFIAGWINADIVRFDSADESFQYADLTQALPWADSSFDEVRAHDIIEHLPDKIHTMNELWRILEPNGLLDIIVPTTDGPGAWQDPTHVSYWNANSFLYFTAGEAEHARFAKAYGIRAAFHVISKRLDYDWRRAAKLQIILRAIK